jgi:hypothetical protein
MAGTMRRRRGTAAVSPEVSPVGLLGSERAGVYCLTQSNGFEVWYARGDDGCIIKTFDVGPGDDAWPAIVALHQLVYGDDDVESWARRLIFASSTPPSPSPGPASPVVLSESARPTRGRTSSGARPTLALV